MLSTIRANTWFIRSKIAVLNLRAKLARPDRPHVSGYVSGNSPGTDILPLIDEKLTVHGSVKRGEAHRMGYPHPTVHLLVLSPDGKNILVQRRKGKDFSSGLLSQTVGGHIGFQPGMFGLILSPDSPFVHLTLDRESFEEAGIKGLEYKFVSSFPYVSHPATSDNTLPFMFGQHTNQEWATLFTSHYSGPVQANLNEVEWLGWFSLKGIAKLARKRPAMFAPSYLKDIEIYQKAG